MAVDATSRGVVLLPRFVRLRDAPDYLGMDRNRFNAEVRPIMTEIPIGIQGVAFDRLDLDAWAEQYKKRNGRPAHLKGNYLWDANAVPDSDCAMGFGTSRSKYVDAKFSKALERASSQQPN